MAGRAGDADAGRIQSGQDAGARRRTDRARRIGIGEPHALRGEPGDWIENHEFWDLPDEAEANEFWDDTDEPEAAPAEHLRAV